MKVKYLYVKEMQYFMGTENFNEDFEYLKGELGFPNDVTLTTKNVLRRDVIESYEDWYDDESREVVGRVYSEVLDYFGYEF